MRGLQGGWEKGLSPETINGFRQNSPELVIRDAKNFLNLDDGQCEVLRKIMLARGINKWLKARRDIIAFKHEIKAEIIELHQVYEKWNPVHKAVLKVLNKHRHRLRKICHQERWVEWPPIADASKATKKLVIKGFCS